MTLIAAVLFLAQAADDGLFKGVAMGDRVEITMKSDFTVRGRLVQTAIGDDGKVSFTVDPAVDLSKLTTLLLDLSLENPDLAGEMGVERTNIRAVRKLRVLTPEQAREIEMRRQEALLRTQMEDGARRAAVAKEDKSRDEEIEAIARAKREKELAAQAGEQKVRAEALARGRAAHQKFPPPQWGARTLEEIAQRRRLKLPVSAELQEFERGYADWQLYAAAPK